MSKEEAPMLQTYADRRAREGRGDEGRQGHDRDRDKRDTSSNTFSAANRENGEGGVGLRGGGVEKTTFSFIPSSPRAAADIVGVSPARRGDPGLTRSRARIL